jgi:hypothetical protein
MRAAAVHAATPACRATCAQPCMPTCAACVGAAESAAAHVFHCPQEVLPADRSLAGPQRRAQPVVLLPPCCLLLLDLPAEVGAMGVWCVGGSRRRGGQTISMNMPVYGKQGSRSRTSVTVSHFHGMVKRAHAVSEVHSAVPL